MNIKLTMNSQLVSKHPIYLVPINLSQIEYKIHGQLQTQMQIPLTTTVIKSHIHNKYDQEIFIGANNLLYYIKEVKKMRESIIKTNQTTYNKIYHKSNINKRLLRCRICEGCLAEDCGRCKNCKDKPRFGGNGIRKKCCLDRICKRLY